MSICVQLRHDFGGFALDVAFEIEKPGITVLFGPSGSGKTSIANAVAGLLRPDKGRIVIGDAIVLDTEQRIFVPPQARRIGYVFQDTRLFPHMNVESNLRFGWRRSAQRANESEFARVVTLLGLAPLLARRPLHLSGGEKSRVALGRALLSAPELLLLDEPLSALDAARKAEIMPYLERLRDDAQIPILYISHSLDEVARLANDVIVLREGQIAAQGSVFDILAGLEFSQATGAPAYGAVIDTHIAAHREAEGLTALAFEGGELIVPLLGAAIGSRIRVRIRAEDVMLATEEPRGISANNILACVVTAIGDSGPYHADVQLTCGQARLLARITKASVKRLALTPAMLVFAVAKSVIVDPQTR
jgi:molybdate transport system ATP-binding protein